MSRVEMILLDTSGSIDDVAARIGGLPGVAVLDHASNVFVLDEVSVELSGNTDPEDFEFNYLLTLWAAGDNKIARQMKAVEDLYNKLVDATPWGLELWFSDDSDEQDPHIRPRIR